MSAASPDRIGELVGKIEEKYRGVPPDSSKTSALKDLIIFSGLHTHQIPSNVAINLIQGIIDRRRQDDCVYRAASTELEELMVECLGDAQGENLLKRVTSLRTELGKLMDVLYPAKKPLLQPSTSHNSVFVK